MSADSLCRRHMPVPGQNVAGGVDVPVVLGTTVAATPRPYSKVCDTFRPRSGQSAALRTDLGRKRLIDFLIPRAMPKGLVRQHRSEVGPACIENGLRHAGLGESCRVDVSHGDVVELSNDAGRELVQLVMPGVADLGVDRLGLSGLPRPLGIAKARFQRPVVPFITNLFAGRERRQAGQSQVYANAGLHVAAGRLLDFDHDVEKPISSRVLRKTASVSDLSFRQRARTEDAERLSRKPERLARSLQPLTSNRNPAERFPTSVAQKRTIVLSPGLGVLKAHGADSSSIESEHRSGASGQVGKRKSRRPFLTPVARVLLSVVAVIPDVIDRSGLGVKQPIQRLHAITIDQNHNGNYTPASEPEGGG